MKIVCGKYQLFCMEIFSNQSIFRLCQSILYNYSKKECLLIIWSCCNGRKSRQTLIFWRIAELFLIKKENKTFKLMVRLLYEIFVIQIVMLKYGVEKLYTYVVVLWLLHGSDCLQYENIKTCSWVLKLGMIKTFSSTTRICPHNWMDCSITEIGGGWGVQWTLLGWNYCQLPPTEHSGLVTHPG